MLSYEKFKEEVKNHFPEYMPEGMDLEYEIRPYHKVNRTMDGLTVSDKNSDENVSPIIYIEEMYSEYLYSGLEETLENGAARMIRAFEDAKQMVEGMGEWETAAKENIVFQLINTEENAALLSNVPHRPFHDLSVIYQWNISENNEAMTWSLIDNQKMRQLGLSEEELFQKARENTKQIFMPEIISMREAILSILNKTGTSQEELNDLGDMFNMEMWVATNNRKCNGANAILYEELFHELAEKENKNFYILPSSIHEVLLVPESNLEGTKAEELAELVLHVNTTQVSIQDRLSNQVYFYDREARKITQITDTVNKRLDIHAAETPEITMPCRQFAGTSR